MTTILISGGSAEERLAEAQKKVTKVSTGVDLVILEASTIEDARLVKAALSRKPYQSKQISIVLAEADQLTPEAQNALLKTLEEPPGRSQLILLSAIPEKLLPTVRSRCQVIDLGPSEGNVSLAELRSAWRQYRGSSLSGLFESAAEQNPAVWAELVRQIFLWQLGGASLLKRAAANKLTDFVEETELEELSLSLDPVRVRRFLALAQLAAQDSQNNVNQRLLMENLFLKLPR